MLRNRENRWVTLYWKVYEFMLMCIVTVSMLTVFFGMVIGLYCLIHYLAI